MNSLKPSTDASSPFVTLPMAQRALSSAPSPSSLKNLRPHSSPKADENSFGLPSIPTAVSLNATSSNCRAESSSGCTYSSAGSLSEAASGFTRGLFSAAVVASWAGEPAISSKEEQGAGRLPREKEPCSTYKPLLLEEKVSNILFLYEQNRKESLLVSGKEV